MLDGILFDGESRGSSISLNSTCSSKSQHDTNPVHVFNTEECTNGYVLIFSIFIFFLYLILFF